MSFLFKAPKMPDMSKSIAAQTKAIEQQTAILEKQEEQLMSQEQAAMQKAQATAKARRRGPYRLLLSTMRPDAQTGIKGSGEMLGG